MSTPNPTSPIQKLGQGAAAAAGLMKGRKDKILFQQDVSTAGSEWVRVVEDHLGLVQSYSDFYHEDVEDTLAFEQSTETPVDRVLSVSQSLNLTDSNTVAGGRTDGGGGGGTVTMTAIFDSNTLKGQVIYVSGDGHVDLAQADAGATATAVGIATQDVLAGQTGEYIPVGPITCDTWTLSPGSVYYLSPSTPGGMTASYPDGSGQFVIILGAAATSTQLNLEIHWMMEQP